MERLRSRLFELSLTPSFVDETNAFLPRISL